MEFELLILFYNHNARNSRMLFNEYTIGGLFLLWFFTEIFCILAEWN